MDDGKDNLAARARAKARAKRIIAVLSYLTHTVPNARDWEQPNGFSEAYEAWEWLTGELHNLLEQVQE